MFLMFGLDARVTAAWRPTRRRRVEYGDIRGTIGIMRFLGVFMLMQVSEMEVYNLQHAPVRYFAEDKTSSDTRCSDYFVCIAS